MTTRDRLTRLENDTKSLSRGLETVRTDVSHLEDEVDSLAVAVHALSESDPDTVELPTVEIEQFNDDYRWRVWDGSLYDEGYRTTYKKARKAALDSALGALFGVPADEPPTKVGKAPEGIWDLWKAARAW